MIETYTDRYGFIGYHESSQLGDIIYEMVEDAKRCVKAGKMQKALYMSEAIIEGLSYAINNADDSDGEISGCLEEALDVLEELAQTDLDESPRVEMFRWLLHHFEANTMAGICIPT